MTQSLLFLTVLSMHTLKNNLENYVSIGLLIIFKHIPQLNFSIILLSFSFIKIFLRKNLIK